MLAIRGGIPAPAGLTSTCIDSRGFLTNAQGPVNVSYWRSVRRAWLVQKGKFPGVQGRSHTIRFLAVMMFMVFVTFINLLWFIFLDKYSFSYQRFYSKFYFIFLLKELYPVYCINQVQIKLTYVPDPRKTHYQFTMLKVNAEWRCTLTCLAWFLPQGQDMFFRFVGNKE